MSKNQCMTFYDNIMKSYNISSGNTGLITSFCNMVKHSTSNK